MYCKKCGKEIQENTRFCFYCGGYQGSEEENIITQNLQSSKNNTFALTGFIISLVSLLINFWGIVGIVALVFSAIGYSKLRECGGKGKGMAITGIVIGIISVIYGCIVILSLAAII